MLHCASLLETITEESGVKSPKNSLVVWLNVL